MRPLTDDLSIQLVISTLSADETAVGLLATTEDGQWHWVSDATFDRAATNLQLAGWMVRELIRHNLLSKV